MSAALLVLGAAGVLAAQNPPPTPPPTPPPAQPPTQPPPATTPAVVTPAQPTAAEAAAAAAFGRPVTNEQISNAIKASGLSDQQVRDRLKSGGYDPALADPFFAGRPGAPGLTGANTGANEFARALANLGILSIGANLPAGATEETTRRSVDRPSFRAGGIFGKDIFDRASTSFDPVTSGPVDPAYRLGITDQLQLVVTGQVELAYQLEVRRDGTVIIPQVGQLSLAGLTLDAAREVLKERMGRSYSGLRTGEARLDLSIARLRSIAVFVIGEVEGPGAYQVNALATVFHALARAGGPTDRGSFRDVQVRRAGKTIEHLDLYDYLLKGDATGDIRLDQGDVIYVPLNQRVVAVLGAVRRPRIFELHEGEGFRDVLGFAGGFLPTASVQRVQIDRIVPPEKRTPGFERVKVDVQVNGSLDSLARVRLLDGDIVTVFNIGDTRRNVVAITGQVFQPGDYELRPKMTLGGVLDAAQGLAPWALADRVKVVRLTPMNGKSELFSVDVTSSAGRSFELQEFDAIEVLDGRLAYPGGQVVIAGAVNAGATRPFVERESLRDAIERSGGLREDAQVIEVSRHKTGASYSDSTSVVFRLNSTSDFSHNSVAGSFMLQRDDRVFVHSSPGFRPQKFVTIEGEFRYPGSYAVTENHDHLSDVVKRAGGPLPGAYPESFKLVREGKQVAVDFDRAMRGDANANIPVLSGDLFRIDFDPRTVFVTGAVSRPALIRYRPGFSVRDYVELAGGPTEKGDFRRAVVEYPSGVSKRVQRVALFFHSEPAVVSGATITVPERPQNNMPASEVWARVFGAATALASIIIAVAALKRI